VKQVLVFINLKSLVALLWSLQQSSRWYQRGRLVAARGWMGTTSRREWQRENEGRKRGKHGRGKEGGGALMVGEPGELWQWLCSGDSTINAIVVVVISLYIVVFCCALFSTTGQGLSFMTADDIKTLPGYPQPNTTHHVQTRLMFYYKTNCELCRAVNANRRPPRRRRQAEFDNTQRVVTTDIVHDVLDNQA